MSDITRLRDLLVQYDEALRRHRSALVQAFDEVSEAHARLLPVYDGVAAREFHAGWTLTEAAFHAYTDRLGELAPLLQERIEALTQLDRPG